VSGDERDRAVADALASYRREGRSERRHPAQVTADRLTDHYEQYFDQLDGLERDALGRIANALREIAEGER
jgi:hypothetical protein